MKYILSLCLLALASVLFVGCRSTILSNVETHATASSLAAMERAITEGARERGWTLIKEGEGKMEATLKVRSHVAVVTILYNAQGYKINYKSSQNLEYNPSNGTIHSNYQSWVRNLDASIARNINY